MMSIDIQVWWQSDATPSAGCATLRPPSTQHTARQLAPGQGGCFPVCWFVHLSLSLSLCLSLSLYARARVCLFFLFFCSDFLYLGILPKLYRKFDAKNNSLLLLWDFISWNRRRRKPRTYMHINAHIHVENSLSFFAMGERQLSDV